MRLQNIYDATPVGRAYLLKFSKTDAKVSLVLESGTRIHSTEFVVEKPNILPSGFAAKVKLGCFVFEFFLML
jgi:predicted ribosome quality control (RQC) complex YloA/Tae2 family protein